MYASYGEVKRLSEGHLATLEDIARRAGVSGATVSNVLRGRGSVGPETARRVKAAALELGYRPNLFARALAEGRAPTIALFFTNITNPFYPQFALEAEHAARRRDHFLLVCNAATPDGTLDTAYLGAVAGRLSEGLIVLGSDLGHEDLLAMLPDGVPAVLSTWEESDAYPSKPCVTVDFRAAGRLAAEHLVELGHRQIGILTGGHGRTTIHSARLAGAVAALRAAGVREPRARIAIDADSIGGGYRAACRLLDGDLDVTALLATNDLLAIGALQAAAERHIPVPDKLSIIGITDIWMAAEMRPALTTIDISTRALAEGSVNLLLDLLADPEGVPPGGATGRGNTAPDPPRQHGAPIDLNKANQGGTTKMKNLERRTLLAASAAAALAPRARAADPITLTVWSWIPVQAELDMCAAANPGLKFQLINAGQAGPEYAKLRTALKAGTGAPDIVQLELSMVRSFAQIRGLADLASFGAADMASLYVPYTWQEVTTGNRINALPWDSGPMGQIYRDDIAKTHGFAPPNTWDEFSDTAKSLAKASPGTFLSNATFSDGGWITGLLWQAGWRPFQVDGDHLTIRIKSEASQRFAAYWQKLIDAKAVDISAGFTTDWYQSLARGRYAIWLTAAWGPVFLSQFAQSSAGKWRAALLPQWDAAHPSNGNYGGSTLAISATSPRKQEAATAIKWLLGQAAPAKEFASKQFLYPVLDSLLKDQAFLDTPYPFFGGQPVARVFAQASAQVGTDFQWSPFNDYFTAQLGHECGAVASGGGSLEGAFDTLQARVTHFARQQGFTVST